MTTTITRGRRIPARTLKSPLAAPGHDIQSSRASVKARIFLLRWVLRLCQITMSGVPRVRCAAAVKPEPAKATHLTEQAVDREMELE
jgi:hypothetical protein